MDIIKHLDQAFGGSPFVPTESPLRQNTLVLVQQAKKLHLSLRYVSFRWSLGRLAMLSPKESQHLKTVAAIGNDEENLVSFYDAYSNNGIPQKCIQRASSQTL